jgi:hypothetical protein
MELFKLWGSILINSDQADKSLAKTDEKAEKVGSTLGKSIGTAVKWGAGLVTATGVAVGGMLAMASKTAETADEIDKLSERTGIGREELQRWKYAAGQSGADVGKLEVGIKKLSDVMDGATNGSESNVEAFNKLGISLNDLKTKSQEDIFGEVMKALADMPQGAERNALGNDLLGKSYTEMLPLLNAGADGMNDLKNRADELGLVMSEETVKANVVFGDSMDDVKLSLGMVSAKISSSFLPVLQGLFDWVLRNTPSIQSTIDGVITLVIDKGGKIVSLLIDIATKFLPDLNMATGNTKISLKDLSEKGFDLIISALTWIKDNIGLVQLGVETLTAVWLIQKGIVLASNVALVAHNVAQGIKMAQDKAETLAIVALYVAEGVHNGILAAGTAAQWLFNAAMTANPIALVIVALVALGVAIYEVVKHWQDIVEWIEKAWNWLKTWNDTPMEDKTSTVTTKKETVYGGTGDDYTSEPIDTSPYGFAVGTRYLPSDMIIKAHEGEMIVPKSENPYANSDGNILNGTTQNIYVTVQSDSLQKVTDVVKLFEDFKQTQRAYSY